MSEQVLHAVIGGYFKNCIQLGWMHSFVDGGYVDPDVIQGPKLTDAREQNHRGDDLEGPHK